MGRDNSPKERQRAQLERKQGRRASYDRILIVTEGSKTEPNYFTEIRSHYRLHTANVKVRHSDLGTEPLQVVQHAKDLFENGDRHRNLQPRAFEQVYAVFDRDEHLSYAEALQMAHALDGRLRNDNKQMISFKAIASVPNFELWLLLHFENITAPLHRDRAIERLILHIRDYEKGARGTFNRTRLALGEAMERARILAQRTTAENGVEPFTKVGELVAVLTALAR